jgi:hypothetical protein
MILQLLNSICVQDLPLHYANCVVSLEYLNQRQSLEHSNFMDDLFLVCMLQFRRFLLQLKDLFKILHIHHLQNQLKWNPMLIHHWKLVVPFLDLVEREQYPNHIRPILIFQLF